MTTTYLVRWPGKQNLSFDVFYPAYNSLVNTFTKLELKPPFNSVEVLVNHFAISSLYIIRKAHKLNLFVRPASVYADKATHIATVSIFMMYLSGDGYIPKPPENLHLGWQVPMLWEFFPELDPTTANISLESWLS